MQAPWKNNKLKAELIDQNKTKQKKTFKTGKLNASRENNGEYWKHDMRTKIIQVKPTGNIVMKNVSGKLKYIMNWLNSNEIKNKFLIKKKKKVEELAQ